MKNLVLSLMMPWLPKKSLSRCVGRLTAIKWPQPFATWWVRGFARYYQIDLAEAEKPLADYPTINALFTRRLRSGVRPLGQGLLHPADGRITEHGRIQAGHLHQVKGRDYTVSQLLGSDQEAVKMEGGYFVTYYLCPTDYHRVHSPVSGAVTLCRHISGQLWPVNEWSVRRIRNLFAVNERTVTCIEGDSGPVYLVMVGATNVGNITMRFDKEICTNKRKKGLPVEERRYQNIEIRRGEEVGTFNMGSTVVVLYPRQMAIPDGVIKSGPCQQGQSLLKG